MAAASSAAKTGVVGLGSGVGALLVVAILSPPPPPQAIKDANMIAKTNGLSVVIVDID